MTTLIFALPGNESLAEGLLDRDGYELGDATVRRFPDGESYVRINSPVSEQGVALLCTLDRPDEKLLPLLFLAKTARELGAARIGLIAPYLAYLRQDRRFKEGESVTSRHFASIVSACFDWLVTIDPHLHRYCCLDQVYSIPSRAVHAAGAITDWIQSHITRPLIVGPDSESEQWVADVARQIDADHVVLEKIRHGDREVEVSVPNVERWSDHTPVILDDIISTARTMIETVGHIRGSGLAAPTCIGVHAIFAGDSYEELRQAGAGEIVTCNTVPHSSNAIDVTSPIVEAVRDLGHKRSVQPGCDSSEREP